MESVKGSEFVFDDVYLLHYICHKINPNRGGSNIHSPDWIKNKKATINPINRKDNKCSQFAVIFELNHKQTGKHSERITKVKTFINKYNWKDVNFPSEKDDWKRLGKNNVKIDLNVLYAKEEN